MANTDYYTGLNAVSPAEDLPSTVERVLYRLDGGTAVDPVLLGYQAGSKLYSDPELQAEVTGTLQSKGKRLVETIPISLTSPDTDTGNISLAWATSESSFHAVAAHPGAGSTLPYRLEVAGTVAAPAASDYALHDADMGIQVFTDDTLASEQITLNSMPESYRWMRMRRTDLVGSATAATTITGQITIVREVV